MRVLFVVGHPAHVHLFRHAISDLNRHGHQVHVAAIEKETTYRLLSEYGISYESLGRNIPSLIGKFLDLPLKDLRFVRRLAHAKPDLVVSTGSPYAAQAAAALSLPHIAFSDTEIASAILRLMLPFTDAICTPSCFWLDLGPKQVRYDGYHELAYLHPSRFRPNPGVLDLIGANPEDRIILLRFASWDSSHDMAVHGLGLQGEDMVRFVRRLQRHGRVLITTERRLPTELRDLVLQVPLHRIHDLLFYATLYLGEGATMASEAGVLGTPWIFVSEASRGYLDDQQKRYGLGFRETSADAALDRAETLLADPKSKESWGLKRRTLLREKIDVTNFIVNFLEGWPESRNLPQGARAASQGVEA